jgi:hypothetical protein
LCTRKEIRNAGIIIPEILVNQYRSSDAFGTLAWSVQYETGFNQ